MIGLDTNVLVRFLVQDDPAQHQRVVGFVRDALARGEVLFVGDVVLAETVWVLSSAFGCTRDEIAATVRALIEAEGLQLESSQRVLRALARFQQGKGGFTDYLLAMRAIDAGCTEVITFDAALLADQGFRAP